MRVSLVITTYNWKDALALTLRSAMQQSRLPEEIIVADDGSTDGTGSLVESIARVSVIPVIHSWQEDKGFRAAMSRNRAIALAKGDYIILIDGDMVLDPYFIGDHAATARDGFFVQGGRVILGESQTGQVISNGNISFSLLSPGIGNRKNCIRSRFLSKIFSRETSSVRGIKTCNFAFWRRDALAVNGFSEEFVGWGREDSDFAIRLLNKGVRGRNLKFLAKAYHLYHKICSREHLRANDEILQKTISEKRIWCEKGVRQYLSYPAVDQEY